MTNKIKEAADRRLDNMRFDDDMKRKVRAEGAPRRPARRRTAVVLAVALLTFAAFTTVAFAAGWIDSIFGRAELHEYGADAKYAALDELAQIGSGKADDGSKIITQEYYDGQQLIVGLAYDGAKYRRMDGVALNGTEPDMPPTEITSYDNGLTIETLQFSTPLPEAARDKDSVEIKIRLGLIDDSADYFRYDADQNAIPATRAEFLAQGQSAPGGTGSLVGDTTSVYAVPRQFEYATLTIRRASGNETKTYAKSVMTAEYSAAYTVIASPVNTKLNVALTGISGETYTAYTNCQNSGERGGACIAEYKVLCDGAELTDDNTCTNVRISVADDGAVTGVEYEIELAALPAGAKTLTIIPVYMDGRDASAEAAEISAAQ